MDTTAPAPSHLKLLDPVDPVPTPDATEVAKDEDILAEVQELEREGLQLRQMEEYAWIEAWRFYNGKHWVTWTPDGRLEEISDEAVPQIVLNFILTMVQTRLGHLIKNRPILYGLPGTQDEKARNATRLAVQAIQVYWRKLKVPKKLAEALLWMLITGKCFWKVWWDPAAGKTVARPGPLQPVIDEATGEPQLHPETGEAIQQPGKPIFAKSGELCLEVCFPHELLVDPGALDLDRAQRVLHTGYEPIGALVDGGYIDKDEAETLRNGASQDDEAAQRARRSLEGLDRVAMNDLRGKVPVKELWLKKSDRYPDGLWAIVIGNKVRKKAPIPDYYEGGHPFVEFDEIKTNSFWSTSTARQLLDVNRIINIEVSQQEHMRRVLRYKTLIPEQGNIDPDAMDERDDEVITYWAPYAPSHLKPPEYTAHAVELRNSLIAILKEIGGNWDVLSGKTQGEVRSGRQTAYLQEYAGTVLGVVAQQIEGAITSAGNKMLRIMQACLQDEQLESFVGRDRRIQSISFRGADLQGCSEIVAQPGSALPISRTERWDRIEHWMEMSWLDPKIGTKLLDLGDIDQDIWGEEEQDRLNADEMIWKLEGLTREQLQAALPESQSMALREKNVWSLRYLLRAVGIEAFAFDDHQIHIQQLRKACQKTRTYREWPRSKRALVDELVEWHAILADPNHGPIEQPLDGSYQAAPGATIPPGSVPGAPGTPPPEGMVPPGALGPERGEPSKGSPQAMQGKPPVGGGGVGTPQAHYLPETGQERAQGLPGVPRPPGPQPGRF